MWTIPKMDHPKLKFITHLLLNVVIDPTFMQIRNRLEMEDFITYCLSIFLGPLVVLAQAATAHEGIICWLYQLNGIDVCSIESKFSWKTFLFLLTIHTFLRMGTVSSAMTADKNHRDLMDLLRSSETNAAAERTKAEAERTKAAKERKAILDKLEAFEAQHDTIAAEKYREKVGKQVAEEIREEVFKCMNHAFDSKISKYDTSLLFDPQAYDLTLDA